MEDPHGSYANLINHKTSNEPHYYQNIPSKLCLFQNRCVQIYDACQDSDAEDHEDDDEYHDEVDDSHVTQLKQSMYYISIQVKFAAH